MKTCILVASVFASICSICLSGQADPKVSSAADVERKLRETPIKIYNLYPMEILHMLSFLAEHAHCNLLLQLAPVCDEKSGEPNDETSENMGVVLSVVDDHIRVTLNVTNIVPTIDLINCITRKAGLKWEIRNGDVIVYVNDLVLKNAPCADIIVEPPDGDIIVKSPRGAARKQNVTMLDKDTGVDVTGNGITSYGITATFCDHGITNAVNVTTNITKLWCKSWSSGSEDISVSIKGSVISFVSRRVTLDEGRSTEIQTKAIIPKIRLPVKLWITGTDVTVSSCGIQQAQQSAAPLPCAPQAGHSDGAR